ncbi:MAG: glycoside hydrolase [Chloroflexi bacterium]|nr:glycoside hydrolase [Chloroflexota bacterium]
MKIAILGAGGVRTPLIVQAMAARQERLGLTELALMDVDGERLELVAALTAAAEHSGQAKFKITRTTDPRPALAGADFVITTFRVGGIAARVIDEHVPLSHGVLGQETTGPGGFAMAMRTIPVLLDYLALMRELCPDAWLINFANPAGLLAEAAVTAGGWKRTVGICDAPASMARVAAALLGVAYDEVYLDYFGLNHLGWIRSVVQAGHDHLPQFFAMIRQAGKMPGLPFDGEFLAGLGLIPNEYLFYYYHAAEAVANILRAGRTRGEQIAAANERLFAELRRLQAPPSPPNPGGNAAPPEVGGRGGAEMLAIYHAYLGHRGETYMAGETGGSHSLAGLDARLLEALAGEGYAGVALDLVEGLVGASPRQMILNVPNRGAIRGMAADDVVEIPAYVGKGLVRPLAVGAVPGHALGLMQQVKAYEQLTIAAATEGSYVKAVEALTIHPLVRDYALAKAILDEYRAQHGALFPQLV